MTGRVLASKHVALNVKVRRGRTGSASALASREGHGRHAATDPWTYNSIGFTSAEIPAFVV